MMHSVIMLFFNTILALSRIELDQNDGGVDSATQKGPPLFVPPLLVQVFWSLKVNHPIIEGA